MTQKDVKTGRKRHRLVRAAATGTLALLGFAPALNQPGLTSQLATHLKQYMIPAADMQVFATKHIAILDPHLVGQLGAVAMAIEGNHVSLIQSPSGEKILAPDGHYKLSDGLIVTVKNGQVAEHAQLKSAKNADLVAARWLDNWNDKWKQHWTQNGSRYTTNPSEQRDTRPTLSVHATFDKIKVA